MGSSVSSTIHDTVDPLKKLVLLKMTEELGKKDFNPLQKLIHGFAKANDCIVHRIYKNPKQLTLEILTKTRLGPTMNNNPLSE